MAKRKTLQELTLKDNFMFGAVMCEEEYCRRLLELILDIPIDHVEVSKEKSIVYHPEYKGVRLDVYAKDEMGTRYNVEMQAVSQPALGKRVRYYHSQVDMDLLTAGAEYIELSKTYVIFICDFDPFQEGRYRYTFRRQCLEVADLSLEDGSETIFLNTRGTKTGDISVELEKFLQYMRADLEDSTADYKDEFVGKLQKAVSDIKHSRRMEERYMLTELLMQDERRAGRIEGRAEGRKEALLEFLAELGTVPENLREKIQQEEDADRLTVWLRLAAKVDTIEQFMEKM